MELVNGKVTLDDDDIDILSSVLEITLEGINEKIGKGMYLTKEHKEAQQEVIRVYEFLERFMEG